MAASRLGHQSYAPLSLRLLSFKSALGFWASSPLTYIDGSWVVRNTSVIYRTSAYLIGNWASSVD